MCDVSCSSPASATSSSPDEGEIVRDFSGMRIDLGLERFEANGLLPFLDRNDFLKISFRFIFHGRSALITTNNLSIKF